MANRLRKQREEFSSEGPASSHGSAFQGDISQVSISTVLTLLELERRSGTLRVKSDGGRRAEIVLADGTFVGATLDGKPGKPTDLLRDLLRWHQGSFSFKPAPDGTDNKSPRQSLGGLLLQAMQLEDEASPVAPSQKRRP
jgi:hypothetical protein